MNDHIVTTQPNAQKLARPSWYTPLIFIVSFITGWFISAMRKGDFYTSVIIIGINVLAYGLANIKMADREKAGSSGLIFIRTGVVLISLYSALMFIPLALRPYFTLWQSYFYPLLVWGIAHYFLTKRLYSNKERLWWLLGILALSPLWAWLNTQRPPYP